jgi:Endonuclease NucS
MEEVRLWRVKADTPGAPRVERVDGVDAVLAEKLLEEVLADSPEVLMEGLTIVGRQNETGGGPLDLLGIDDDGKLVVFELKRGELTRDAVAQVLDYASWLSDLDPEELGEHISEMSGRYGTEKIDDFADWYRENFDGKTLSDIGRPRMVLVGLGADATTKRMVEFLATTSVDMTLITFYGFTDNGETLLARQVEVEARATKETNSYRATKAANEEKFRRRLRECGLEAFYKGAMEAIKRALNGKGGFYPNASGHTVYFQDYTESGRPTSRAYIGLSVSEGLGKARKVALMLQGRVANTMSEQALATLASELKANIDRRTGYVEMELDGTGSPAAIEAGLKSATETAVRIWQDRQKSSGSSSPVVVSSA